jgi:hypothetical protein
MAGAFGRGAEFELMAIYPLAPWRMRGFGAATVQFVDARAAARFVPSGCAVVAVAPGKTLGGLLFVSYEAGSSLVYHELNIVAALVRAGKRLAFSLPRLYVDSAASLAGGRVLWGVPKELAAFDVAENGREQVVTVSGVGDVICRLSFARLRGRVPAALPLPAFGSRGDRLLSFTGRLRARLAPVHANVELRAGGEFVALGLDRPLFAFAFDDLALIVPPPIDIVNSSTGTRCRGARSR